MRFRHGVMLAALVLGGCGPMVDDPGNAPRLGRWERTTRVIALIANDVWIDRADVPFTLPDDETVIKNCIEPELKTGDQINRELMKSNKGMCQMGPIARHGRGFSSSGTCGPQEKGGSTISGTIEVTGRETEERAEAKLSAALVLKSRSGASERIRFGVETKWKRLGDCG